MIYVGQPLTILPTVNSTNNYAMARIRAGLATHGEAWLALEQTAGRGQQQKSWLSEPGCNITLSIALQPGLPLSKQFLLNAAITSGICDLFNEKAGGDTHIKWPNDIYWRDRKAGGILIENQVHTGYFVGGNWAWAVVGIGLNINQAVFPAGAGKAVSLLQITGKHWDIIDLSKTMFFHIQERLQLLDNANLLLQYYNSVLYKRGETVRLKKEGRVFNAVIKEVNEKGELVTDTGLEELFRTGQVQWV